MTHDNQPVLAVNNVDMVHFTLQYIYYSSQLESHIYYPKPWSLMLLVKKFFTMCLDKSLLVEFILTVWLTCERFMPWITVQTVRACLDVICLFLPWLKLSQHLLFLLHFLNSHWKLWSLPVWCHCPQGSIVLH